MAETQKLYTCECHTCGFTITNDDARPFDIWVSFWKYGQRGAHGWPWKQRIKHIWAVITRGHAYDSMIVLSQATAKEIGQRLIELSEVKPNA